jgi:surface antigen
LQTQQLAGKWFRQRNVVSFVLRTAIVVVCGLLVIGAMLIASKIGVHAQSSSANTSRTSAAHTSKNMAAVGHTNAFPYGACTWWADQRYYQLHGVFVPWRTNANARQWPTRAQEFGWRVSRTPRVGDIIALQGGVQGASWLGHVGVVEQVLGKGRVVASSMSWGSRWASVTRFQFTTGPGVAFIGR